MSAITGRVLYFESLNYKKHRSHISNSNDASIVIEGTSSNSFVRLPHESRPQLVPVGKSMRTLLGVKGEKPRQKMILNAPAKKKVEWAGKSTFAKSRNTLLFKVTPNHQ